MCVKPHVATYKKCKTAVPGADTAGLQVLYNHHHTTPPHSPSFSRISNTPPWPKHMLKESTRIQGIIA